MPDTRLEMNHLLFPLLMGILRYRIYQNFCVCRAQTCSIFYAFQPSITKNPILNDSIREKTDLFFTDFNLTVKNHCHRRSKHRGIRSLTYKSAELYSGFCGAGGICQLLKFCNLL